MKNWLLLTAAVAALTLVSCNTMIGVSRDIRATGAGMENVAHGRYFDGSAPVEAPADLPPPATY